MTLQRNAIMALLAITMIGVCIPFAAAQAGGIQYQHSAGIVTLETDELQVRVTGVGEVPHFHYWSSTNPTVDYHVMFVKMFEANDTDADGAFTLGTDHVVGPAFALPTADWIFSGFDTEESGGNTTAVHFNLTSTEEFNPRPDGVGGQYGGLPPLEPFDVEVQIRVHMNVSNPNEFKFDLIVDGWTWTYSDSIFVFQFTVTESNHGQNQGTRDPAGFYQEQTTFKFGNGYMQYEGTALAANNTLQVKASHGEGTGLEAGESVYLSFENFGNDTLVYDPTLGVVDGTVPPDTGMLLVIGGAVALVVIVALVLKLRK